MTPTPSRGPCVPPVSRRARAASRGPHARLRELRGARLADPLDRGQARHRNRLLVRCRAAGRPRARRTLPQRARHGALQAAMPEVELVVARDDRRDEPHDVALRGALDQHEPLVLRRDDHAAAPGRPAAPGSAGRRARRRSSGRGRAPRRPRGSRPPAPAAGAWPARPARGRGRAARRPSTASITAHPAAHATGLPPNVVPWAPVGPPRHQRRGRADRRDREPVRDALRHRDHVGRDAERLEPRTIRRSGRNPVCTSSNTSRAPWRSARSRSPSRNRRPAGWYPPSPCTGSTDSTPPRPRAARGGADRRPRPATGRRPRPCRPPTGTASGTARRRRWRRAARSRRGRPTWTSCSPPRPACARGSRRGTPPRRDGL